ncbi:MAG: hypothetical protein AAGE59_09590 [Cyanobacteria bacterium P01_F01_bin.86]
MVKTFKSNTTKSKLTSKITELSEVEMEVVAGGTNAGLRVKRVGSGLLDGDEWWLGGQDGQNV